MDTRVAIVGIIVEDQAVTPRLNELLTQYGEHIIGRLGLPYRARGINVISIVMDAPQDTISALSGKLGMLPNVSSKTIYSRSNNPNKTGEA